MGATLNQVIYALRPAKNIERKMMCEVFVHLARVAPLGQYRYVGMGALGFHDHSLFHRRLGIRDLVSIERNEDWRPRVLLNRPFNCIEMEWGHSSDCLPRISWRKRAIVWLDYDDPLDRSMLDDVHTVAANLRSGSVLVVTATARPDDHQPIEEAPAERLAALKQRIGEDKVPAGTEGKHLGGWGLASVTRQVLVDEIDDVLGSRNGPMQESARLGFHQLFNFQYADGSKMVTVGGIIATPADFDGFRGGGVEELSFVRTDEEAMKIDVPKLTMQEIRYLNQRLPNNPSGIRKLKRVPSVHAERYAQLYRYFPSFSELESVG